MALFSLRLFLSSRVRSFYFCCPPVGVLRRFAFIIRCLSPQLVSSTPHGRRTAGVALLRLAAVPAGRAVFTTMVTIMMIIRIVMTVIIPRPASVFSSSPPSRPPVFFASRCLSVRLPAR